MKCTKRYCGEAFATAINIDYGHLSYVAPFKAAIQMIIGTVLLWDNPYWSLPFQLGTLVISVGDRGGTIGNKIQSIGIFFAAFIFSALLGAISYIYPVTVLPIAFASAFITSLPFGGHLFMFHKVLTCFLPVYVSFAPRSVIEPIAWTAIAGGLVFAWSILPEIIGGTYEGIRTELFQAWLQIGRGTKSLSIAQFAEEDDVEIHNIINEMPTNATKKILMTFDAKRYSSNTYNEKTKKKIQTLVRSLDILRCGFIILLMKEKLSCDEIPKFQETIGKLCQLVAHGCQNSWLIYFPCYKRRISNALDEVNMVASSTIASLSEQGKDHQIHIVQKIQSTMQEVVTVMKEPWERSTVPNVFKDIASLIKLPTYTPRNALWVYCVRISIVYTLSTVPMFLELQYGDFGSAIYSHWFPMTLSIISTPEIGGTLKKVLYRGSGSCVGVSLGALGMYFIQITLPNIVLATILFAVAGFGADSLYFANYGFATMFITMFVCFGSATVYDDIGVVTLWRFVFTMAACALYLLSMVVYCPKESDVIASSLTKQAKAVYSYSKEVNEQENKSSNEMSTWEESHFHFDSSQALFKLREDATKMRIATVDSISDACLTSIWKGDHKIDPFSVGPAVCIELLILICIPLLLDMLRIDNDKRQEHVSEASLERLLKLVDRLEGKVCTVDEEEEDDDTMFNVVIARVNRTLDAAEYNLMQDRKMGSSN